MSTADPTPVGTIRPLESGRPGEPAVDDEQTAAAGVGGGRPRRRWLRRTVLGVTLMLVAMLAYYCVSLYQVWSTGRGDQAQAVDAIVVLGAAQYDGTPSPQLAARLDQVVRLWPEGHAPLIVTTGGSRPGDRFTEAEASAAYLVEHGISEDVIVQEDESRTSYESLENVSALLAERELGSVLLVTDPFHALRSRMIAEDVGLTAYVSPTETSVVGGGRSVVRHLEEAGGVMLGRIVGFEHL